MSSAAGIAVASIILSFSVQGFALSSLITSSSNSTLLASKAAACRADCAFLSPLAFSVGWAPYEVTTNITAATVFIVVKNGFTTTSTTTNQLPKGYTVPQTNDAGTVIATISTIYTLVKRGSTSLSTLSTTLAYPTDFVDYPDEYAWSGTIPTTSGEHSICSTNTAGVIAHFSTHPLAPQFRPSFPVSGNKFGSLYTTHIVERAALVTNGFYASVGLFEDQAAFSLCRSQLVAPAVQLKGAQYLTETSSTTLDDDVSVESAKESPKSQVISQSAGNTTPSPKPLQAPATSAQPKLSSALISPTPGPQALTSVVSLEHTTGVSTSTSSLTSPLQSEPRAPLLEALTDPIILAPQILESVVSLEPATGGSTSASSVTRHNQVLGSTTVILGTSTYVLNPSISVVIAATPAYSSTHRNQAPNGETLITPGTNTFASNPVMSTATAPLPVSTPTEHAQVPESKTLITLGTNIYELNPISSATAAPTTSDQPNSSPSFRFGMTTIAIGQTFTIGNTPIALSVVSGATVVVFGNSASRSTAAVAINPTSANEVSGIGVYIMSGIGGTPPSTSSSVSRLAQEPSATGSGGAVMPCVQKAVLLVLEAMIMSLLFWM